MSSTIRVYAPTGLPDNEPYKSLYWDSLYAVSRKDGYISPGEYPDIENITLPSPPNFVYVYRRALISANSYQERFGVKSLWILCRFQANISGAPCRRKPSLY